MGRGSRDGHQVIGAAAAVAVATTATAVSVAAAALISWLLLQGGRPLQGLA